MCSENSNECDSTKIEIFLDTSIHIARLKSRKLKKTIGDTLNLYAWRGTCGYAKLEYGNNILSIAGFLLDKLKEKGRLERLRFYMHNELPQLYYGKHVTWFSNLLHAYFNEPEATERAERSLRHLLRMGTDAVSALCDETRDGIKCSWANQDRSVRWKNPSRSKFSRAVCRIDEFFAENQVLFCSIRDAIRKLKADMMTDELQRFAELIDQACQNPKILRDCGKCPGLADALIAVHSHSYGSFFTQNIAESQVLCPVMKQKLVYLPQGLGGLPEVH